MTEVTMSELIKDLFRKSLSSNCRCSVCMAVRSIYEYGYFYPHPDTIKEKEQQE